MTQKLGFVAVYNLLSEDYADENLEWLEETINDAISQGDKECPATEENMVFSFPTDPSVKSQDIPIMVVVELLTPTSELKKRAQGVADLISSEVMYPLGVASSNVREVAVLVRSPGGLTYVAS